MEVRYNSSKEAEMSISSLSAGDMFLTEYRVTAKEADNHFTNCFISSFAIIISFFTLVKFIKEVY